MRYNLNWQNTKIKKSKRQNINVIRRCKWNRKDENDEKDENENENEKENEKENDKTLIIIKELNDVLDEIIDKSK